LRVRLEKISGLSAAYRKGWGGGRAQQLKQVMGTSAAALTGYRGPTVAAWQVARGNAVNRPCPCYPVYEE